MKSKNGKILEVRCNNTVTIPLITAKKIVPFLEVAEVFNALLPKAYSAPRTPAPFLTHNLTILSEKW